MDCENCRERLPDFLLDELPESEAVLVHEHLNLCNECMRSYVELKGTGKALEKIPALRPLKGSAAFAKAVRESAMVELGNLVEKLPADKRLRLEARRAARMTASSPRLPRQTTGKLKWAVAAFILLGLAAATAAIVWSPREAESIDTHRILGSLTLSIGNVEQFYQREGEPHTPVKEGKNVAPNDAFFTRENGRARYSISDGGTLFLGPSSQLTFRVPAHDPNDFVYVLESGEIGIERPSVDDESDATQKAPRWEVRTEAGHIVLNPGSHAYIKVFRNDKDFDGEVTLLYGSAEISQRNGKLLTELEAGQRIAIHSSAKISSVEPLEVTEVPQWRVDLVSDRDLARLLNHPVKVQSRRDGIQIEVIYGRSNKAAGFGDWIGDAGGMPIAESVDGIISLPARNRLRHVVPFAAPLAIEMHFNHDSLRDTSFAFGALHTTDSGVAVDMAQEAVIQVREKGKTIRKASISTHEPGKPERLTLEVKREKSNYSAILNSSLCNTTLPLDGHKRGSTGDLWLQALGDGILIDEIKICGIVPTEWLRERLSKSINN